MGSDVIVTRRVRCRRHAQRWRRRLYPEPQGGILTLKIRGLLGGAFLALVHVTISLVRVYRTSVMRAVISSLACASTPASAQVAPMSCGASARETRWPAESYNETHTYGLTGGAGSDEWIGSYGGLAATGDSLFLYDQLRPGIVHLSGELEERGAFGRAGEGPGEFDMPFPVTWVDDVSEGHVAFDGRNLVVYDRHDLASFDANGEFRWSARLPTFSLGDGVRFVRPVNEEEVIFGVDSLEARRRRLQLWRVQEPDPNHRVLLWQRPIPRRVRDRPFRLFTCRGGWGGSEAES